MSGSATAGWLVDGRYEVREPLGRGGFGVVWRARDLLLERDVAVKEIRFPGVLDDTEQAQLREKVLREARAAARLNHPGAVTVFDVVEDDGRPVIVMELVEAPTLAQMVERHGPLSPAHAASIGLAVLETLAAAHAVGIVHRDVKPANVMVEESGRVRLADFGIAAILDDPKVTTSGAIAGSPCYMAPEQALNERVGPAADLWSLAATLYLAVEGEPPFDKGSVIPTMTSIVQDPPRPYRRAGPLAPVLTDLLVKDPDRRLDAGALRARLQALAVSEPAEGDDDTALMDVSPSSADSGMTLAAQRNQSQAVPPVAEPLAPGPPAEPRVAEAVELPVAEPVEPAHTAGAPPAAAVQAAPGPEPGAAGLTPPVATEQPPGMPEQPLPPPPSVAPEPPTQPEPRSRAPVREPPSLARAPAESRRWLGALLVGLAVLVLGAILIIRTADETPTTSSPDTTAATPDEEPSPTNGSRTGRSSSERPTTLEAGAAVPRDWVSYTDPATGYRISHPPDWEVRTQGTLTDFRDPASGAYLRVDHTSSPGADPVQAWVDLEQRFAAMNDNYQRIQIAPTRYAGFPAAIWEFTYTSGGAQLRAVDLGFVTGRYGFALNFQTRARDWDRLQPVFAAFRASFQAPSQ